MIRKPGNTPSPVRTNGTFAELESQLRPSDLYELEWIELCTELVNDDLKEMRHIGLHKGFKARKLRSIYWALLLNSLGLDSCMWLNERRSARNEYAIMRELFNKNPYQQQQRASPADGEEAEAEAETEDGEKRRRRNAIVSDDPLSQSSESVWHQHFCDQELIKLINQDVARTFCGVDIFRQPQFQTHMANILFAYARANPTICYRQGMHELLAPLLFVVHSDHEYLLEIKGITNCVNPTMFEMLDPQYLEADTFALFTRLMQRMETYYKIRNVVPTASGEMPRTRMNSSSSSSTSNNNGGPKSPSPATPTTPMDELDMHIKGMRVNVLARHDPEVDEHLTRLNIPLSVIGIRWYRLLFGREVSFADLLTLWDAVFADNFRLTKFLPAAMLISVRQRLLTSDFVGAYECLMNVQESIDVRKLIKYSLYLQDGQKYKRPEGVFVAVAPRHIRTSPDQQMRIQRSGTMPSRAEPTRRSPKLPRGRANSLKRVPAVNASLRSDSLSGSNSHELGISDGYLEDDPAVLKMNIEYLMNIMAISRLKLQQFANGLRENLPPTSQKEVSHCLDGLEELCAFMEPRPPQGHRQRNGGGGGEGAGPSTRYTSPPVERAYAADELENGRIQGTPRGSECTSTPKAAAEGTRRMMAVRMNGGGGGGEGGRSAVVETKTDVGRKICCDRTTGTTNFVVEENATESQTMIMTASILNDLSQTSVNSVGSNSTNGGSFLLGSSYEYPEHRIPREAQRVIGDRREVELVEMVKGADEEEKEHEMMVGGSQHAYHHAVIISDFVPKRDPQGERRDSK